LSTRIQSTRATRVLETALIRTSAPLSGTVTALRETGMGSSSRNGWVSSLSVHFILRRSWIRFTRTSLSEG